MTKTRTRRALFLSFVSMFLCFAMLLGTTYAWFTDSVNSGVNTIVAGNLDVELEYASFNDDGSFEKWNTVNETVKLFDDAAKWEPGHAEIAYLKVSNLGNLALKYQLTANVGDEVSGVNVYGREFKLSEYLVFKIVEIDAAAVGTYTRESAVVAAGTSMGLASIAGDLKSLDAVGGQNTDDYVALIIYMPTTVDNEANHNGVTVPSVKLGVSLFATQVEAEMDSFGDDYDAGTPMPTIPVDRPNTGDVVLTGNKENAITVVIPASVADQLPAGVTSLGLSVSTPVVDTTTNTITYESIEVVDQDGNVIDLANYTGAEDVTIVLPAQTTFAANEVVAIYHDDELVATAAVAADSTIPYEVAHLCEVKVGALVAPTVTEDGTVEISSAEELFYFANSVNAGESYAGKTVVLTADIDLNNTDWTPIGDPNVDTYVGFQGTFDGQNHTISNLNVEADTWGLGLFGYMAKSAVVTNLKVNNAYVKGTDCNGVIVGYATHGTFTNIAVTGDVTVIGTAPDGHVGGIAGCGYNAEFSNCSVIANAGSVITSNGPFNGGIVGYQSNRTKQIVNCYVKNVNITGASAVGGVSGIIAAGTTVSGCSVENVVLTKTNPVLNPSVGLIVGCYDGATKTDFTNNTVKNVTINAESVAYDAYNMLYGSEYSAKTPAEFDVTGTTTDGIVKNMTEYVKVTTADELVAALEAGKNVVFANDIKIEPAKMSNAYGKTGVNVKKGQTIDGNGYTLDIKGAGGTWDSGINTTGGVIKNITVTGSFRGIFINHTSEYSEKVVLENVIITGVTYTISCDQGLYQTIEATNCTFNGWTSFAKTAGTAKFVNCTFGEGSGYKYCRPYSDTEFVNCTFCEGYSIDTTRANVTFTDCVSPNK